MCCAQVCVAVCIADELHDNSQGPQHQKDAGNSISLANSSSNARPGSKAAKCSQVLIALLHLPGQFVQAGG